LEEEEKKRLLTIRRRTDEGRPKFVRPESWRYKRLHSPWRRGRGIDNKVRRHKKGWPESPKVGYRSPKAVRTLHPSGLKEVLVHDLKKLSSINPDVEVIRIGGNVGARSRSLIISEADRLGIRILNPPKEVKESESQE
jgi:large subunit ribosomal protein L32e